MKFLVSTVLYRLFEVEAHSRKEAEDIIRATDDLDTLEKIAENFEIQEDYFSRRNRGRR